MGFASRLEAGERDLRRHPVAAWFAGFLPTASAIAISSAPSSAMSSRVSACGPSQSAARGFGMDVDHHRVRAGGYGRARERSDELLASAGVRRVDDHGQVRERLRCRHGSDVERVAVCRLVGADTALAQDDVVRPFARDVLGSHQPFLDRRRTCLASASPRAPIGRTRAAAGSSGRCACRRAGCPSIRRRSSTSAGSRTSVTVGIPVSLRHHPQDLKAALRESLERVGRGAVLVRVAAQDVRAHVLRHLRGFECLLLRSRSRTGRR